MEIRCRYSSVYVKSFRKHDFKRMRYPVQMIITALSRFYLVKNSFRNISLILKTAFNIKVSHTTVSNWCVKFAPMFDDMRIQLVPLLDLNSDEWHADETVIKIAGVKHYIWFIIGSETRSLFVSIICGMLLHYGPRPHRPLFYILSRSNIDWHLGYLSICKPSKKMKEALFRQ